MILAVVGLFVPTFLAFVIQKQEGLRFTSTFQSAPVDKLSVAVAAVLFLLYIATVIYQLRAPAGEENLPQSPRPHILPDYPNGAEGGR